MRTVAVRNIPRGPADAIQALGVAGVATVHEAMGRSGLMAPYLRPIYAGASIAGSAVTVLVAPGDNWMLHVAIELCQPGDVLVVGVMCENTDGMIGDLISTALQARGVRGVVIDAGCRDVKTLTEMGFPVWSRAISARGTVKTVVGNVNLPVVCAGAMVNPGDAVIADDDGVVVVPRLDIERIAGLARQRTDKEDRSRPRYAAGELSLDVAGMRAGLEAAGLVYVDSADDL
ncbi:4-carboxy-4-hydroxy-2-oxoadipate aldolase/oxaloacetate decarboxylase [Pigmentiphaga litoralis]|uniref:4-hydroxy-4-methyl-2-oxoglutarate aldolase n=1 Tax=Pigmentiphaga litoralis TaxID=516702 RepID=A0A7Y9LMU5_9BURK|nr:4-carboxy-4-hydroxy-2-oxoadipate aldolase/oxaloacetate decarboxylase [Pigmentiphaga litoralis]NYE23751.1 4-hydroxy-4-methyl-2-oxoglutarate aldolase [Pigmentiphaga litoralis]NYE82635.1 4-hydroxy-4-methyl-2-oxoglutarate aldolase [Pigmentiphaga litoralis]